MASNPLFIILPDFFCIFPMNFAIATLGLKEMGKFLWEGISFWGSTPHKGLNSPKSFTNLLSGSMSLILN